MKNNSFENRERFQAGIFQVWISTALYGEYLYIYTPFFWGGEPFPQALRSTIFWEDQSFLIHSLGESMNFECVLEP